MLVGIGMSRGELVPPRAVIRQVRRRWPVEQKRRIVEATYAPGASIAQVAREHGVNANQLHSWRRLCQAGRFEAQSQAATLLPVRMIEEPTRVIAQPAAKPRRGCSAELLQLEALRGRLRIQGAADPRARRMVPVAHWPVFRRPPTFKTCGDQGLLLDSTSGASELCTRTGCRDPALIHRTGLGAGGRFPQWANWSPSDSSPDPTSGTDRDSRIKVRYPPVPDSLFLGDHVCRHLQDLRDEDEGAFVPVPEAALCRK